MRTIIIAEAGVNHNGDVNIAKKMIKAAKDVGADYIKFQTFKSENLVLKNAQKAEYQKQSTGSNETQIAMLKKLELSFVEFEDLKRICENEGIGFLSTPFDFESADFLQSIGMQIWKIPSGEITNLPLLVKIARYRQKMILSTGISNMGEIQDAVKILNQNGSNDITIMHCTTQYPAPFKDVNLNAILTMRDTLKLNIGYSDHTEGIEIALGAVALGATIIEKHFTLDNSMKGPDHLASIEPEQFKKMVKSIRNIEKALGSSMKKPTPSEICNRDVIRKSIVSKCYIAKGDVFTEDNITTKRPGTGISPMKWFQVIGTISDREYQEDEFIQSDSK